MLNVHVRGVNAVWLIGSFLSAAARPLTPHLIHPRNTQTLGNDAAAITAAKAAGSPADAFVSTAEVAEGAAAAAAMKAGDGGRLLTMTPAEEAQQVGSHTHTACVFSAFRSCTVSRQVYVSM